MTYETTSRRAEGAPSARPAFGRRRVLQGTLATGAVAAFGGVVSRAMAAPAAVGPKTVNRQWLLTSYVEKSITADNFKYQEAPLGDAVNLSAGDVLVRNVVYAPLPSQRVSMHADSGLGDGYLPPMQLGKPVRGVLGIARVVKSENPKYPVGALITSGGSWEDYSRVRAAQLQLPPLPAGIDPVDAIGIYGFNAQTAYFGLLRLGEPKAGETVVVSGASGSVGSTVIQIARNLGCKVIGISGGKEKCERLVKDYGITAAIDYKSENITERLHALAPKGVNVYFDNVGGPIMQDVVDQMAKFGRVVLCGAISAYDDKNPAPGPRNMLRLVVYSVSMRGFLLPDFNADRDKAIADLRKWKEAGQITFKTDVRQGFKKLPESFLTLFTGDKDGTLLVKTDEVA